ncbi:hypothetical protein LCGC14_1721940 [marine sediment metagenome]|uniref:NTP pyrophosphohydrolase MazG putative catalytic core domain-containing protein n=1 Tax=marine sediment metagenome TaxID=412755 RepID=A0A0F9HZV4_9ZZZZ
MNTFIKDSIENMLRTETSTTFANIRQRMLHAMIGFADEGGEFIKMVLRATFYNQPVDIADYKEELGDLWWNLCLAVYDLAESEKCTPEEIFREILDINKAKLKVRYPEKYSNIQARIRDIPAEKRAIHNAAEIKLDDDDEKE